MVRYDTGLSYAEVARINKTCATINPKPVPFTKNRKKFLNIVPKPVPRVTKNIIISPNPVSLQPRN